MKRIVIIVGLVLAGGASNALADQLAPSPGVVEHGPRAQGPGMQGQGMQRHRLPRQVRRQLVQRFDRDGDGRLDGRERRAAKRFVKRMRHQLRQQGAGRQPGERARRR